MKARLRELFGALPLIAKIFWFMMGGSSLLLGVVIIGYSLYWELMPEQAHFASFEPNLLEGFGRLLYGLVVTVAFGLFGAFRLRKQRERAQLIRFGQRIDPPVYKVEESLLQTNNGQRHYYIYSPWQDSATGKKYIFESERLDFDPSAYLRRGDTLPIYFELGNPEKYYVDVSQLPKPKRSFWQ